MKIPVRLGVLAAMIQFSQRLDSMIMTPMTMWDTTVLCLKEGIVYPSQKDIELDGDHPMDEEMKTRKQKTEPRVPQTPLEQREKPRDGGDAGFGLPRDLPKRGW